MFKVGDRVRVLSGQRNEGTLPAGSVGVIRAVSGMNLCAVNEVLLVGNSTYHHVAFLELAPPQKYIVSLGDEQYRVVGLTSALEFVREHADETRVIVIMPL